MKVKHGLTANKVSKKVRVYYVESIKSFYIEPATNPNKIAGHFSSHLCLLNPTFRYVKKWKRLECRGTIIPFSYEHNDIRSLCKTYYPVTLELVGCEVMASIPYWNGDRLEPITKGKLALLSGGRVHVYGAE